MREVRKIHVLGDANFWLWSTDGASSLKEALKNMNAGMRVLQVLLHSGSRCGFHVHYSGHIRKCIQNALRQTRSHRNAWEQADIDAFIGMVEAAVAATGGTHLEYRNMHADGYLDRVREQYFDQARLDRWRDDRKVALAAGRPVPNRPETEPDNEDPAVLASVAESDVVSVIVTADKRFLDLDMVTVTELLDEERPQRGQVELVDVSWFTRKLDKNILPAGQHRPAA